MNQQRKTIAPADRVAALPEYAVRYIAINGADEWCQDESSGAARLEIARLCREQVAKWAQEAAS